MSTMRRMGAVAVLGLVVTGCGPSAQQTDKNQQSVVEKSAAPAQGPQAPGSEGNADVGSNGTATNPGPSSAGPSRGTTSAFVGLWATSKANCRSNPWHFTSHELSVRGGPSCTFYQVTAMPGGYDIAAQCPTKKPVPTDLIKVRFAQSAGAMLVESNALQPTGLVRCAN